MFISLIDLVRTIITKDRYYQNAELIIDKKSPSISPMSPLGIFPLL